MKIERGETFVLNEVVWKENVLVPNDDRDETTSEFIRNYRSENFSSRALDQGGKELSVTIALCFLGENERWRDVARELKKEGWSGASLTLWKLYVQDKKDAVPDTVTITGTRFRDDEFQEWFPVVRHRPLTLLGRLRGCETKVSMKPWDGKFRTVLISKTKVLKT